MYSHILYNTNRSIFQIRKQNNSLDVKIVYRCTSNNKNDIVLFDKNMGCNHSFKKPNNLKEIYNAWDQFIDLSLNQGNSHIAFTINIDDLEKEHVNILKMHPIGVGSEKWDIYSNLYLSLILHTRCHLHCQLFTVCDFNKLVSWLFITTEENEQGVLHAHGIIAYRNLTDYNKNISNNILNRLRKYGDDCDVVLKDLNNFKNIKGWIRYLHKDKVLVFPPLFKSTITIGEILEKTFTKPYINNYHMRNNFRIESDGFNDEVIEFRNFVFDDEVDDLFPDLKGIMLNKNELNENIFIDLILNYLILKKYFLYNDNIYEKVDKMLISYKKVGSLKEVLFDKFENNIILFFTETFPCQFKGFDFYFLIKTFKNKMESSILKIKNLTTNKINLNFFYLEFNDGVYDIKNNKFVQRNNFNERDSTTIKYYNKSYSRVRHTQPENWIEGIKNAVGKDNAKDFTTICLFIASLFQEKNDDIKKNFLYIYGQSNTGKSTFLTKVLTRYYGLENIGNIVNSTNFKFQDILNKLIIIMDEFRYSSSSSSDFLKLLGGEPLLTTQKYNKDHVTIDKNKGFILSNNLFSEKNESVNKALLERLHIIEFLNVVCYDKSSINELLKDEEPSIIIFCNKLYFSYLNKKSKRQIKVKNRKYEVIE